MKAFIALCLLAGLVAATDQPPPRPTPGARMSPEMLRRMAQPLGAEPIEVLDAEKAWAAADVLLPLTQHEDGAVRTAAARALGRLEDPRLVPTLLTLKNITTSARADAVAQSLKGFDPSADPRVVQAALEWMHDVGSIPIDTKMLPLISSVLMPMSRISYSVPEQVHRVEELLLKVANFTAPDPELVGFYVASARAFEALARINGKVTALEEDSAARLAKMVRKSSSNDNAEGRLHALLALLAGRSLDEDSERAALKDDDWQVRRVAVTVLAGGGAGLDDEARAFLIDEALDDRSGPVRYEALRAYVRRVARTGGCLPIEHLLADPDQHVSLAAIDALGELCKDDEELTERVMAEARMPSAVGSWHRETHAFVALAKRSPERARPSMEGFVTHPVWWVRMYAAGAAAVAGDLVHLDKLAYDTNDNVREAALAPLRRLKKASAGQAIVDALGRSDPQLVRTAAILLKESPRSDRTYRALVSALRALTAGGKETSRDTRLALLEAVAMHASPDNANELLPLLKDFDPKVAEQAAQVIIGLSGKAAVPEPVPYRRGWAQEFKDLRQCVIVQLAGSGSFRIRMEPRWAPIAVDRFLGLVTKSHYYDGMPIHRVVPNFVIQGGSPGANEYAGHKEYMRDEVGGRNVRGSVGLSTRGRNTGDAQFFINLVDNPRLDYDYTVFATVMAADMPVVDKIQEGDVMTSVNLSKCPSK